MALKRPIPNVSATGLAAGAAAGLAAALLAMLTPQHPPLTFALGFSSPLPVMIATLAFGLLEGGLAVVVGAIFVTVFEMKLGRLTLVHDGGLVALEHALLFAIGLGIPAWVLAFLARLPPRLPRAGPSPPRMRPDELRLSRVVIAAILFGIAAMSLWFALKILEAGGLAAYEAGKVMSWEALLKEAAAKGQSPITDEDLHHSAMLLVQLVPWLDTGLVVVGYLVNLWLTARVARTSGAFGTEWPDIARNLRLPRFAALLLAVSLGLSFTTGPVALASHIVSAALIAVFSLQGLAVIHAVTRGRGWRMAALIVTYGLVPFVFWALLGLLDSAFSFRDRQTPVIKKQPERKSPWK